MVSVLVLCIGTVLVASLLADLLCDSLLLSLCSLLAKPGLWLPFVPSLLPILQVLLGQLTLASERSLSSLLQ